MLSSLQAGQVIEGTVQRITDFGAFVDIGGMDGLVHISQLSHQHVEKATDVVEEGQKVQVKVLSVDLIMREFPFRLKKHCLDHGRILLKKHQRFHFRWKCKTNCIIRCFCRGIAWC